VNEEERDGRDAERDEGRGTEPAREEAEHPTT
jgi:hypothetical protein